MADIEDIQEPAVVPKHVWEKRIDLGDGSGVQVFQAESAEELVEKLAKAQEHATRKIRELNRRIKLGDEQQPEADRRFKFEPRQLTDDEKWRMGTEMSDPAKASEAVRQVIESQFGAPIEQIREAIAKTAEDSRNIRAQAEAKAWADSNSEYHACPENSAVMVQYLERNGFACTKKNLDIAFDDLNSAGLLKSKPVQVQPTQAPTSPTEEPVLSSTVNVRPRQAAATGLRQADASTATAPVRSNGPSPVEIANMSAEEYRVKILLPNLAANRRSR